MLVGRRQEQLVLSDALASQESEFLVIYGRRRIGKTFLIESFFLNQECTFFHITGIQKGMMSEQLAEFIKEIGNIFYGGVSIEVPATWMKAFEALSKAIDYQQSPKPIVLFFDEFPWMASPRSRLLQALEYYWNRHWKNNNRIKLILCGSSAAWIIKKIIHHKGGLHNRITKQINLKPFNLTETKQFLDKRKIKLNRKQVLEIYSIVGGVPYYLNHINKGLSIAENVNNLCFQKEGLLFNEFNKLFSSLFQDSAAYEELIRLISSSRHGVSRDEIEAKSKLTKKGGALTQRLQDLEMAGFIKGFLPVGHRKKGLYYRVLDEYSLFYLQWIEPEKHNITVEIEGNNFWLDQISSPQYLSWRGYSFESVCYKHVANIKKTLNIRAVSKIGTWRYVPRKGEDGKGAQIDLLFDRKDDAVTICEIKYSDNQFSIDKRYADVLKQKVDTYRKITRSKKQIFVAMITAHGLKQNEYASELITNGTVLDDLFDDNES